MDTEGTPAGDSNPTAPQDTNTTAQAGAVPGLSKEERERLYGTCAVCKRPNAKPPDSGILPRCENPAHH